MYQIGCLQYGFNSTLVQLKDEKTNQYRENKISFNSTLVQLKVIPARLRIFLSSVSILP